MSKYSHASRFNQSRQMTNDSSGNKIKPDWGIYFFTRTTQGELSLSFLLSNIPVLVLLLPPSLLLTPWSHKNMCSHSSFCFSFSWQHATGSAGRAVKGEQRRGGCWMNQSWIIAVGAEWGTIWESECEGHLWALSGWVYRLISCSAAGGVGDGALTSRCSCAGQTPARCPWPWGRRPGRGCASGQLGLAGGLYWRRRWTSDPV